MNVLDIILLLLLLFGTVTGFMRGLFVELASLVALLAGIYGAIHFSNYAATFLENQVEWEQKYISAAAFAITFIIIVLVISLAGKALTKLADFAMLGIVNKLLGAVFGLLKTAFILSIILVVFEKINPTFLIISDETKETSAFYSPIYSLAPMVFPIILDTTEWTEGEEIDIDNTDENPTKEID